MAKLGELARLVRSKNAGPFLLTFDVLFDRPEIYQAVKRSHVLNAATIGRLYGIPEEQVRFTAYDPGLAFKATIPRPVPSGDPRDGDVYGAQQHAPLVELDVPLDGPVDPQAGG